MRRMRRVALIYDAKLPYDVKVIRGVARYLQQAGGWNVLDDPRPGARLAQTLRPGEVRAGALCPRGRFL